MTLADVLNKRHKGFIANAKPLCLLQPILPSFAFFQFFAPFPENGCLSGHMAKANPHWKEISGEAEKGNRCFGTKSGSTFQRDS